MFKFNELKGIHLEITNRCQAACPMCARNHHGGLPNPNVIEGDWTLEDFKQIITPEVLDQIDYYYFCGNFGDPMVNNDLIKMIEYSNSIAPHVSIRIHTNAGARKPDWWKELASVCTDNDTLVVALDGLEDTHHLYRVNTTYERVIENATAFIDAGGKADWAMLVFKHNEHQIEEARKRAEDLGFKMFYVKNSSRFVGSNQYEVYDKDGNTTHVLEPSSATNLNFITKQDVDNFQKLVAITDIDCMVKKGKEVYIDAHRHLMPCCFIASAPYDHVTGILSEPKKHIKEQYNQLVKTLGGLNNLHTINRSIKDIINSQEYQTAWNYYWNENKLIQCARTCGVNKFSKPNDQFIEKIEL